jgi:hypothetical protein
MSAAAHADSPISYPFSQAATRLLRFIETSGEINEFMKMYVINLPERGLRQVGKRLYGAKIAVMGLACKKSISDLRELPAIKISEELANLRPRCGCTIPSSPRLRRGSGCYLFAGERGLGKIGGLCSVKGSLFWHINEVSHA